MYPASQPGSKRHTLSVLVENRPGVLARIAGLFARRAFNINSLSVSPTERPDISRVTVTADVDEVPLEQIIKQLNKLLHVLKIVDLDPNTTVERELVLIKVTADESNRSDVLEIVRLFRVRVVDVNPESLTIEATGAEGKIDALLGLLEHYGIIELVRSGAVAVTRGPKALSEKVLADPISLIPNLQRFPVSTRESPFCCQICDIQKISDHWRHASCSSIFCAKQQSHRRSPGARRYQTRFIGLLIMCWQRKVITFAKD